VESIAAANEEAREAWDGVLFDRFVEYRDRVVDSLGRHGDAALRLRPPRPGDRVLDIGCGFGDTTQQLAALVGADGSARGIDVAERFIETARREAEEAGTANVDFAVGDVQIADLGGPYDYVFSRFGTMFFANPVAALRNVAEALAPGGRLCMVVWRRKLDNDWLHRAELAVKQFVEKPEESDEPTCGPGPFSMADADTTSEQLAIAGFEAIDFYRCDIEVSIGDDLGEAIDFLMAIGPAGEVIRLAGDEAERIRPKLEQAVGEALSDYATAAGVVAPSSTWIVTASPAASGA
jgi:ubiquinone/menaquinone biosynthesis C-methylase UbiE